MKEIQGIVNMIILFAVKNIIYVVSYMLKSSIKLLQTIGHSLHEERDRHLLIEIYNFHPL